MYPLGDDDFDTEINEFDSQLALSSFIGDDYLGDTVKDTPSCPEITVPFDDIASLDDVSDTQVMDLAGETQALDLVGETQTLDLAGETQALDLAGETQPLDLAGETQALDITGQTQEINFSGETQAMDFDGETPAIVLSGQTQQLDDPDFSSHSNGEATDITEVLKHVDNLIDDELVRRISHSVQDQVKEGVKGPIDALPDEKGTAGSLRFASLRAESLRASGLAAARRMAYKEIHTGSFLKTHTGSFLKSNGVSFGKDSSKVKEKDEKEPVKVVELNNENTFSVGSSTVRKLVFDDSVSEDMELSHRTEGEDLPPFHARDDQLAGLSYIDSQEPGDLSQVNALNFVDKFLENNAVDFDLEANLGKGTGEKLKSVHNAKGPQSLAKIVNSKTKVGESGIFEWDDKFEDETGGEILQRRKEELFNRSLTQPRKRNEMLNIHNVKRNKAHSDSRLLLQNLKENRKIAKHVAVKSKRNLAKEWDEQYKTDSSRGKCEGNVMDIEESTLLNVGVDTQLAAEAMEALFNGDGITDCDINDNHQCLQKPSKKRTVKSSMGNRNSSLKSKKSSFNKRVSISDVSCASRQVRKGSSVPSKKWYESIKQCETEPAMKKSNKGTSNADENMNCALNGVSSVMKRLLDEKVGEVSPIARRTRHSLLSNKFKTAENGLIDSEEPMNHLTEVRTLKKTRTSKGVRSSKLSYGNVPTSASDQSGELNYKLSGQDYQNMRKTRLSMYAIPLLSLGDNSVEGNLLKESLVKKADRKNDAELLSSSENTRLGESPRKKRKQSDPVDTTPDYCKTPVNDASPVCKGNEYYKQSCRRSLSKKFLSKEINSLIASGPEPTSPLNPTSLLNDSRKRREISDVRVLYSHHLDDDIVKQQQKILNRLGISMANSITDSTHFIADKFVRTRNMLEAIALGKLVVTHLWIDSCGQASCFMDEKNYILRDAKKEKEFGFKMPVSLAYARQRPLLQGRRVLITENTKPGKDIISSLVKAVKGQAVERIGRSGLKDDKIPDDILVLSCEEDYDICVPILEKGAAIYSSELLLNGIVTQKLEFERHHLFEDHVKRTRSTMWLKKKDGDTFLPVSKHK